jgi:hypothetical protein
VEFDEIQQTIQLEKQFEGNSWAEFWSTPGNRHRSIILISIGFFSQWSGNGIVSYFLPQVHNQSRIKLPSDLNLTITGLETHWNHQQQHSPDNQSHSQRGKCCFRHWYLLLGRLLRKTQTFPHIQYQHVGMLRRNDYRACKVLNRV